MTRRLWGRGSETPAIEASHPDLLRLLGLAGIGRWSWDLATDHVSWTLCNEQARPVTTIHELVQLAMPEERDLLSRALDDVRNGDSDLHHRFLYITQDAVPASIFIDGVRMRSSNGTCSVVGISRSQKSHDGSETVLTKLFEERDRVARALEAAVRSPTLPDVAGLTIDVAVSGVESQTTGDFHDLFPLRNGDWAFTIGDVGGHDSAAAALTTAVRYALRASALVRPKPARVLEAANSSHLSAAADDRFTTCHYLRLGPLRSGVMALRIATAGHPPIIIRRASARIDELTATGPMLGLMEHPEFGEAAGSLRPGDIAVAYTDGLTEQRKDDEPFGHERLIDLLRQWDGPVNGLAHHLHTAVLEFSGTPFQDDVTTVAIQVQKQTGALTDLP